MIARMQPAGEALRSTRVGHSDQLLLSISYACSQAPNSDWHNAKHDSSSCLTFPSDIDELNRQSFLMDSLAGRSGKYSMVSAPSNRILKDLPDMHVFV